LIFILSLFIFTPISSVSIYSMAYSKGKISLFLLGFAIASSEGADITKQIIPSRTPSAITIDGRLTEKEWNTASEVSDFQQFDPEEGAEPTERTSVKILYDDNALYVGVMCYDSDPSGIVEQLTRRDRTVQADRISVIIDSYHDHSTAFLFSGSVSGVQSDGLLSQDGIVYDIQWDAVWDFNAKIISDGWSAEFKIPFSALRFAKQDSAYTWGINFRRYIARKKETDEWVMVRRNEAPTGTISSVSKMGHLVGLHNISPPLHLEIMPYGVSSQSYLSQPPPFPLQKKLSPNAGVDIKYGLTNNFTLDVAINPDFGQVEVDQAVLNLTVFETFYPEKRPFFLEGAQIFSFGTMFDNRQLRMFYSRRIGKRPFPTQLPDAGYALLDEPRTTTILGAGKLTGKTDNGLAVGILTAVTDREEATEENTDGVKGKTILYEPQASYNVVRLKQDILKNSSVGFIATGSFKDTWFPKYSGGLDWNFRTSDGQYAVDGYVAGSYLSFTESEVKYKLLPYEPGNKITGGAGRIGFGKLEAEHWLAFSLYDFATRNFLINDLGYYGQPKEHGGFTQVTYKEDFASAPLRRYAFSLQHDYRWNWNGAKTTSTLELESANEFVNFWTLKLNYYHFFPAFDDESRGIVPPYLYRRPSSDLATLLLQTDPRRSTVIAFQTQYQTSEKNLSYYLIGTQLTLRPNTWMEFTPSVMYASTRNEEAWPLFFYTSNGRNLFGDRDIDQYDFSLRGTITFTRSISLQFFTQILLAKGQYPRFKELTSPENLPDYSGTVYYYDYNQGKFIPNVSPDFNEKTLNANLVFRWEYLPGSTFYLVWTQARYGDNGIYSRTFGDNFSDAFKLPMDNVILAKITYWWSL
jgi:hypothetical protein